MKAFEFGHETSYTKSSSHPEFKACFHLIDLFYNKALTVKMEKTCKKRCLRVVSIKCQK